MNATDQRPTSVGLGRWRYGSARTGYAWSQCSFCGRAQDRDCEPVDCMACGSRQCFGNGSGNGCCKVCVSGYLPGWSREGDARVCGYKGCDGDAVSKAPRVGQVCGDHLARAKLDVKIAQALAVRDAGTGWQRWRWVEVA